MSKDVVSSFPFEEWAQEAQNALQGRGIPAVVEYAGPRAYPVLVDPNDSERAAQVMSDIGYLSSCAGVRSQLAGTLDWYPPMDNAEELADIRDDVLKAVNETIEAYANSHAAEAWSTQSDDEEQDGVYIVATFGHFVAMNGDLVDEVHIPAGYVRSGRGGRVPVAEEEVDLDAVFDRIRQGKNFQHLHHSLLDEILEDILMREYEGRRLAYVSVSGDAEFYEVGKDHEAV
jgi:hypothetical protein